MTFEKIQKQAISEGEALQSSSKPRLLVGAGTCGSAAGALDVLNAINEELKRQNIEAIVIQVGCMGLCFAEPMVGIVKPGHPQIIYGNLTPEIATQLVKDYLVTDNPRPDLALGYTGDGRVDGIPNLLELPVLKPQVRVVLHNCSFIDPENINHYIANGGYSGLAKALKKIGRASCRERG